MSINIKSAATPEALTSANEEKLFVGSLFAGTFSNAIELYTALHADLNKCIAFTKPGLIATESAMYMSLGCLYFSDYSKQDIILLKFTGDSTNIQNSSNWSYIGTLLEADEASIFDPDFLRFTGSEIEEIGGNYYLFVTPGSDILFNAFYNGCIVYTVPNLDLPSVNFHSELETDLGRNDFYGVCTYNPSSVETGIIYGFTNGGIDAYFQILASGDNL